MEKSTERGIIQDRLKSHVDTKISPATFDQIKDLENIQMHPVGSDMRTPVGTLSAATNQYKAINNIFGT